MIIKDIVICSYMVFLILQPLPELCTCEGHCCWICHWPGKFILCSCVWEWDEKDPEPRSFVHVACSCTYMFAISMRDVVALLNASCFALTMAKLRHAFCTKRGILYLFRCIILGQAYPVVLPFGQLVFVDCPYFEHLHLYIHLLMFQYLVYHVCQITNSNQCGSSKLFSV